MIHALGERGLFGGSRSEHTESGVAIRNFPPAVGTFPN